ncbi:MAG: hypothetical protein J5I93_01450 [Pirellulaceae bacterium]|nr:hypothetical protein [Pirellulaceae bacterium]
MPGIDFRRLRAEISMEQVLALLDFEPSHRSGPQWYGRCPLHESTSRSRPFSVNVSLGSFSCHRCHKHGDVIDLWAAATGLLLHPAAIDLCDALRREVPWIQHGQ